jgi:hypothetical protein
MGTDRDAGDATRCCPIPIGAAAAALCRSRRARVVRLALLAGVALLLWERVTTLWPPGAALCQLAMAPIRPAAWTLTDSPQSLPVRRRRALAANGEPSYTVVVSTFKRDEPMVKNVGHWLTCPYVKNVQVIWHDPVRAPPAWMEAMFAAEPRVQIVRQKTNRLSNRFRIDDAAAADALFTVDDDVHIDCRLVTEAFSHWRPDRMVGFAPRRLDLSPPRSMLASWLLPPRSLAFWDGGAPGRTPAQGYDWYASCRRGAFPSCGTYNTLFVTKGGFIHKKFYEELLFNPTYARVRELVDEVMTGEDMLMSAIFGAREVLVVAPPPGFEHRWHLDHFKVEEAIKRYPPPPPPPPQPAQSPRTAQDYHDAACALPPTPSFPCLPGPLCVHPPRPQIDSVRPNPDTAQRLLGRCALPAGRSGSAPPTTGPASAPRSAGSSPPSSCATGASGRCWSCE